MPKLYNRVVAQARAKGEEPETRIKTAMSNDLVLHELDYQDVTITPQGAEMVKRAACSVIDQYMPAVGSDSLTVREAISMFIDHIFWDEKSGRLFMCTDVVTRSVCLPLPKSHWGICEPATPIQ